MLSLSFCSIQDLQILYKWHFNYIPPACHKSAIATQYYYNLTTHLLVSRTMMWLLKLVSLHQRASMEAQAGDFRIISVKKKKFPVFTAAWPLPYAPHKLQRLASAKIWKGSVTCPAQPGYCTGNSPSCFVSFLSDLIWILHVGKSVYYC